MQILPEEIKIYLSGGSLNTNPNNSLGGAISNTLLIDNEINNLFDGIIAKEARDGDTSYRCVYIKNESSKVFMLPKLYINSNTVNPTTEIFVGKDPNAVAQIIADEYETPIGVTFSSATDYDTGIDLVSMSPGDVLPIWIKYVVDPNTVGGTDEAVIAITGDSTP